MHDEPFDLEEALAEAERTPPSQERLWEMSAQVAMLLLRALPGGRIQCGNPRHRTLPADYVTPLPNPPLNVYGPDGRFVVSFTPRGSWIDAQGVESSFSGILEGGPESIARMLLRDAGLERRPDGRFGGERRVRRALSDGLPRLLEPTRTGTWRDGVGSSMLRDLQHDAPATIAWPDRLGRLLVAPYDPRSCTFTGSYDSPRWGVESLRIPALLAGDRGDGYPFEGHEVCPGDCVVTWGTKHDSPNGRALSCADCEGSDLLWYPQRVVHVEQEGAGHLRAWLLRDDRVANRHQPPSIAGLSRHGSIAELTGWQRRDVLAAFARTADSDVVAEPDQTQGGLT